MLKQITYKQNLKPTESFHDIYKIELTDYQ